MFGVKMHYSKNILIIFFILTFVSNLYSSDKYISKNLKTTDKSSVQKNKKIKNKKDIQYIELKDNNTDISNGDYSLLNTKSSKDNMLSSSQNIHRKKNDNNWKLWTIGGILLIGFIGGATYYLMKNNNKSTINYSGSW